MKTLLFCLLSLLSSIEVGAAPLTISVSADKTNHVYSVGEEVEFTITARNKDGNLATNGVAEAFADNFGVKPLVKRHKIDFSICNPHKVSAKLDEPGFVRLTVKNPGTNDVLWGAAVSPKLIRQGGSRPTDFEEFWKAAIDKYDREVREDIVLEKVEKLCSKACDVYLVMLTTPHGRKSYGRLSVPTKKGLRYPLRLNVAAAGPNILAAGGRTDEIQFLMNVHYYRPNIGANRSEVNGELQNQEDKEWTDKYPVKSWKRAVEAGIGASREEYFYYDAILAIRRAFYWAAKLPEVDSSKITYSGGSQGGAFGIYMTALCPFISRGCMMVPAITDIFGYKVGRKSGWPSLIEQQLDENLSAAERNAPYFDAVNFAPMVKCPVRLAVGFIDTTCPPTAVYSAYNVLGSADKDIYHGIGMGHATFKWISDELGKWERAENTPVTAGWENINKQRTEVAPAKVVWSAAIDKKDAFKVEMRNGAKGEVLFHDGKIIVEKTNEDGYIIIKTSPFSALTNQILRVMADVHCERGDYFYAQAGLRAFGKRERIGPDFKLEGKYFYMGGPEEMQSAVNQAPGMTNRKYCHYRVQEDGEVTAAIIVAGSPSKTIWSNWMAEDLFAADCKWAGYYESRTARDRSAERIDEAEYDKALRNDVDHTACLKKVDGITRLVVDGKVAYPTAYRAKGAFGKDILLETFAGGALVRSGVKLVVKGITMGGSACAADGLERRYWTPNGFDAVGAVKDIKNSLRITPDALCVLSICCNAYPDFTLKEHPDEVWIKKDGSVVVGTSGSCVLTYDDMGVKETNRWPWVSYASPSWRTAVCDNIKQLIAELKRQGLSKRIVGLHLSGYHDGQFFSPYEDHSKMAKAEFQRYLKEDPVAVNDFAYFSKLLGFKAQEEFARTFKRELGKPSIVFRWNMMPFTTVPDQTDFAFSDVVDIIVPQPTYTTRRPGMAAELKLPYSSFNLHNKMFWYEFDLRTYAALEPWAMPGVVSTKALGQMDDFEMWQSGYHKMAGMMFAQNCGYWFYDMGGGWFATPEIATDVGDVLRIGERIIQKPNKWRPAVSLVVDEEGMGVVKRAYTSEILRNQLQLFAASGVQYNYYLAEDVIRDPSLVADSKTIVLAFFRNFDERRQKFAKEIMQNGRTIIFLAGTAVDGGADVIGFEIKTTNKVSHVVIPCEGVSADEARSYMVASERRIWPHGKGHSGPRCTVVEKPTMKVLSRYQQDAAPALVINEEPACRKVYVCEPAGLTPKMFNRLVRESGAYVPVDDDGLQINMNGNFISAHALRTGRFEIALPFRAKVVNLKNNQIEAIGEGFKIQMTAGETCWFELIQVEGVDK